MDGKAGKHTKIKLNNRPAVTINVDSHNGTLTGSFSRTKMSDIKPYHNRKERERTHVSAYLAATELLRNFTDRRQLYDRGAMVSQEMSHRVTGIAEAEDAKKFRSFLPTGNDFDDLEDSNSPNPARLEDEAQELSQKLLRSASSMMEGSLASKSGLDIGNPMEEELADQGNGDIALKQMCEEEIMEAQIAGKQDKLEQLRGFQRSMAEILDQLEEEKSIRENLKATGFDATSEEYERKMRVRTNKIREVMRANFEALIADKDDIEIPPEPNNAFSIHNLSTSLELLGKSIATIVEATDEICVTSTFKTEGEPATIFLCVKALKTHAPYCRRVHELVLSHLAHYERGEQAILEGGAQEINRLRERFLLCKDQLIIEEQKLKAAEEHRESLKKRLLNIHQRCDMWEVVLLQRECQRMGLDSICDEDKLSHSSSASSMNSRKHVSPMNLSKNSPHHTPVPPSALVEHPEHENTPQGRGAVTTNGVDSEGREMSGGYRSGAGARRQTYRFSYQSTVDTALEDNYETQVAASWGNPYVNKARQYEQACINRAQSRIDSKIPGNIIPPLNTIHFDESAGKSSARLLKGYLGGKSLPGKENEEAITTSYTRRLALLQSLLRSIPASTFGDVPRRKNSAVQSSSDDFQADAGEERQRRISASDEQLRRETRLSIQRLIRYTAQHVQHRTKEQS